METRPQWQVALRGLAGELPAAAAGVGCAANVMAGSGVVDMVLFSMVTLERDATSFSSAGGKYYKLRCTLPGLKACLGKFIIIGALVVEFAMFVAEVH